MPVPPGIEASPWGLWTAGGLFRENVHGWVGRWNSSEKVLGSIRLSEGSLDPRKLQIVALAAWMSGAPANRTNSLTTPHPALASQVPCWALGGGGFSPGKPCLQVHELQGILISVASRMSRLPSIGSHHDRQITLQTHLQTPNVDIFLQVSVLIRLKNLLCPIESQHCLQYAVN